MDRSARFRPAVQPLEDRITPALSFASQQTFATSGLIAAEVVVADFNGDGRPDVATANGSSDNVSVLRNVTPAGGPPAFAAQVLLAVGDGPFGLAAGDFDGDGRIDLATANYNTDNVSVLLNTTAAGAATLSFAPHVTFAVGDQPYAVAAGDFDGDGRTDLVTANYNTDNVSVLRNGTAAGAAPTFAAQVTFAVGDAPNAVAVEDVNGDGRADVLVANSLGDTLSILRNTTATGVTVPAFAAQVTVAVGDNPSAVAVADLDGDGRPDLVTANTDADTVSVLRNTTATGGTTLTFAAQSVAVGDGPSAVAAGDFDGDGRADLAVASFTTDAVAVLTNATAAGAATPTFAAFQAFDVGDAPDALRASDFDGDGRADLVTANQLTSNVSVLRNTSTGGTVTGPVLVGQFGGTGVWRYNRTANTWGQLDPRTATALAVAANGNAVANFAGAGVWYYRASTNAWTAINGQPATALAMDQYGNTYINFGPSFGTYRYSLAAGFVKFAGTSAGADKMAVGANGDVIANFTGFGVFRYRPTTGWVQINGFDATALAVDPNGYVVANFAGFGVGRYIPYAAGWQLLTPAGATSVAVDGLGNVFAAFAGYGLGRWSAATGAWTNVAPGAGATSLAADWFGNVTAAVPGYGVAEYRPFAGWFNRRMTDAGLLRLG